jgi:hypothetical protein
MAPAPTPDDLRRGATARVAGRLRACARAGGSSVGRVFSCASTATARSAWRHARDDAGSGDAAWVTTAVATSFDYGVIVAVPVVRQREGLLARSMLILESCSSAS